ncbi:shikimate dehydrogenase [Ignicoccus islandicus DSM 13165]|uniref:Shikimate dehydrogenase (NADP(+)) n=1 Tax=Ignicoccus islandicus DSM 13165 TaxID=940295 RepID=A0A0U3DVR6_9CREN|nr:shikimate dehydrogenase [Ignicoccus islandicus]ALU11530.1 shikimate dehydrogenase [Ignicoccus islandicus DSM 13165]
MKYKTFAVIGKPIEHSLSPLLHSISFELMGIRAWYTKVEVGKEELGEFMRTAPKLFTGINVTIPLKEEVTKYLDEVRGVAREVGAVNTVKFEGGKAIGYNTDVEGVRKAVSTQIEPKGLRVAIIGAGGAARAAVVAFYKDNEVTIFNRTEERGRKLAEEFGVEFQPLSNYELIKEFDLVVNATPVGLGGRGVPIPPEALREGQVVMDMVYNPLLTPLLRNALLKGCKVVDGLKMLVIQGLESEVIWLGLAPTWEKVYSKLLAKLAQNREN